MKLSMFLRYRRNMLLAPRLRDRALATRFAAEALSRCDEKPDRTAGGRPCLGLSH